MAPKKGSEKEKKPVAPPKGAAKQKPAEKPAAKEKVQQVKKPKAAPKASTAKKTTEKKERKKTWPVYIRGLDFEGMDHDSIKEVFKPCGAVTEVRLRHGKFVLVFFRQRAAAAKAIEMDGKTVKGSKISVRKAVRAKPTRQREHYCTTIYAGGLPGCTTKGQLFRHFKSAGKILKIRLHQPFHHAFVYFQDNKAAKKAMALKDVPFAHGKDVSKLESVPIQWQRKLHLRFSIRTKKFDRQQAKKAFNRRPPSEIEADRRKSEKRQVVRQKARRLAALGKKVKSSDKKSSAKKSTDKKKSTDSKKVEKKAEAKKPEAKKPEPKKSEEKKVEKKSEEKKPAAKATPKAAPQGKKK